MSLTYEGTNETSCNPKSLKVANDGQWVGKMESLEHSWASQIPGVEASDEDQMSPSHLGHQTPNPHPRLQSTLSYSTAPSNSSVMANFMC
jgi:hypothetical protein